MCIIETITDTDYAADIVLHTNTTAQAESLLQAMQQALASM